MEKSLLNFESVRQLTKEGYVINSRKLKKESVQENIELITKEMSYLKDNDEFFLITVTSPKVQ